MNNYKVNIKYGTSDLNNILIKVLNSELKKHIIMICVNVNIILYKKWKISVYKKWNENRYNYVSIFLF